MQSDTRLPAAVTRLRAGRPLLPGVALLLGATLLGSCAYYLQAAAGQVQVLRARQPLEQVLSDPSTPAGLRQQLLVVDAALVFARVELGLPRSDSYRQYADLGRPYVVWNVFAAPEFSLVPREWCYPVAGCATYRGWFSESRARANADALAAKGEDVFVGGVTAYSTLGWFADPVLNTMLNDDETELAAVLFHELTHQKLYVPGDTLFNEGFATFVEEEGTRRWLVSRNDRAGLCRFNTRLLRRSAVLGILTELRAGLGSIYAADLPVAERRQQREAAFSAARDRYAALRSKWRGPPRFDGWFDPGLNNARLSALASYEDYVPAFRALLAEEGGDLPGFYTRVAALADIDGPEREASLRAAARVSVAPAGDTCP